MAQITGKELTFVGDLLSAEQTVAAKCAHLAATTEDKALSDCYRRLSKKHEQHMNKLYENLK